MNFFTVDILTPNKIVAKDIVAESLLVPTTSGQINILANHTHIITSLCIGELSVFGSADNQDRYFVVNKGICKVLGNKVTILSELAEESYEIDKTRAELSLKNAQDAMNKEENFDQDLFDTYLKKIELSKLRIQLSEYQEDRQK